MPDEIQTIEDYQAATRLAAEKMYEAAQLMTAADRFRIARKIAEPRGRRLFAPLVLNGRNSASREASDYLSRMKDLGAQIDHCFPQTSGGRLQGSQIGRKLGGKY